MATKEQILGVLAGASGPMNRSQLEQKIGESYRRFQTQLDRWADKGIIEDVGDHSYVLTDDGRELVSGDPLMQGMEDVDTATAAEQAAATAAEQAVTSAARQAGTTTVEPAAEEEIPKGPTQASVGSTEYQLFIKLGRNIGVVPNQLIEVTANHIWNGGNYEDLTWVGRGLQQMDIRRDLANRWLHSWGSHLKKVMPLDLPADYLPVGFRKTGEFSEEEKKQGVGLRDYILDEEDRPVRLGTGRGTLDYQDAMDLAKIRGGKKNNAAASGSAGSMAEEVSKIFSAFKEIMGPQAEGKSYIVKPGENGYQVEEVDPGKPVLVPAAHESKPAVSYLIDQEGKTQEIQAGQPVVIVKEAPRQQASPTQQFLVDQRTGEIREIAQGQPIIIKQESAPSAAATPLQMLDKDGNPIIFDINTYMKLEDHKEKIKRDDESHRTKMDIASGFKDLLKKASNALSNMGEG